MFFAWVFIGFMLFVFEGFCGRIVTFKVLPSSRVASHLQPMSKLQTDCDPSTVQTTPGVWFTLENHSTSLYRDVYKRMLGSLQTNE